MSLMKHFVSLTNRQCCEYLSRNQRCPFWPRPTTYSVRRSSRCDLPCCCSRESFPSLHDFPTTYKIRRGREKKGKREIGRKKEIVREQWRIHFFCIKLTCDVQMWIQRRASDSAVNRVLILKRHWHYIVLQKIWFLKREASLRERLKS